MDTPQKTTPTQAPVPKKPSRFNRHFFTRLVWYVCGVITAILALRMLLLMLGANMETPFVSFIYDLSWYFSAPFLGMFSEPDYTKFYFDVNSLVAIIVYWLAALGLAKFVNLAR